jgi:hypothetical protein
VFDICDGPVLPRRPLPPPQLPTTQQREHVQSLSPSSSDSRAITASSDHTATTPELSSEYTEEDEARESDHRQEVQSQNPWVDPNDTDSGDDNRHYTPEHWSDNEPWDIWPGDEDNGAAFVDFVDVNGERTQMKLKWIEAEDEREYFDSPQRAISPFDPVAPPRSLPPRPSVCWIEEWLKYIELRRKEFNFEQSQTKPTPPLFRPGCIDFDGEECQQMLKEIELAEQKVRGFRLLQTSISPFDPTAPPRQIPTQPSLYWLEYWVEYLERKANEARQVMREELEEDRRQEKVRLEKLYGKLQKR